jgi:hypothetical protein
MRPPRPEPLPPSEGRDRRGRKLMEEDMREISVYELEYMASRELCELARKIDREMPIWPESSLERSNGLITLRNIRWVLERRRDFAP